MATIKEEIMSIAEAQGYEGEGGSTIAEAVNALGSVMGGGSGGGSESGGALEAAIHHFNFTADELIGRTDWEVATFKLGILTSYYARLRLCKTKDDNLAIARIAMQSEAGYPFEYATEFVKVTSSTEFPGMAGGSWLADMKSSGVPTLFSGVSDGATYLYLSVDGSGGSQSDEATALSYMRSKLSEYERYDINVYGTKLIAAIKGYSR